MKNKAIIQFVSSCVIIAFCSHYQTLAQEKEELYKKDPKYLQLKEKAEKGDVEDLYNLGHYCFKIYLLVDKLALLYEFYSVSYTLKNDEVQSNLFFSRSVTSISSL